ncbi:Uncharacterised protein [Mycobacteroides abscessus subsp. abscessus]|nr:Uncharacterised protein [Mycobacteroides abscessus subsp. abscessus]
MIIKYHHTTVDHFAEASSYMAALPKHRGEKLHVLIIFGVLIAW